VLGGQSPSTGATPVDAGVANGASNPTDWFTDANFTGVADPANLDQAETFALCATGGPAHTVVATSSTVGANSQTIQQVDPPVPATATCPAGDELIGGGAVTTTPDQVNDGATPGNEGNLKPLASYPSDPSGVAATDGSTGATSWSAFGSSGIQNDGGGPDTVTAYALCSTDPSPPPVEVARVDVPGPVAQPGTTTITGSATCPAATQLLGGGYAADETVGSTSGLEPQQGYHMRGSYPSSSPAASAGGTPPGEVADGTANPETWTALLQLGGQTLPAGDFGTLHVYAMCAMAPPPPASADLSVTLSGSPNPVLVGQPLTYAVGIANSGPANAAGVAATINLPADATIVSATSSTGSCTPAADSETCTIGALASGASATATIVVTPTQPGSLTAAATVSGSQPDPNSANDTASATTMADLATRAAPTLSGAPGNGTLGGAITDQVTLAGGSSPSGTISFSLYGPGDTTCTVALASSTAPVAGNGTYSSAPYTAATAGTYRWVAAYSGDGANAAVAPGACGVPSQTIAVRALPTLTVRAFGATTVGGAIMSQATLAGGTVVTGSVTLSVFGPGDTTCAHALASVTIAASGDGIYGSNPFVTPRSGTYRWVAAYSGDALNYPVGPTPCGAAAITVGGPPAAAARAFVVATPKVAANGLLRFVVTAPGRGELRAVATIDQDVPGKRGIERIRYGSKALAAKGAGSFTLEIAPGSRARLLRSHHTRLLVTLVVTFTPAGEQASTRSVHLTVNGTIHDSAKAKQAAQTGREAKR
jgi:uncharacterized repeat protein (TIGR01451 family)